MDAQEIQQARSSSVDIGRSGIAQLSTVVFRENHWFRSDTFGFSAPGVTVSHSVLSRGVTIVKGAGYSPADSTKCVSYLSDLSSIFREQSRFNIHNTMFIDKEESGVRFVGRIKNGRCTRVSGPESFPGC